MGLSEEDVNQVKDLIQKSVVAAVAAVASDNRNRTRSSAEVGSPEFAEDRTQVNSLNNKFIFETAITRFLDATIRSSDHLSDLQSRGLQSLDGLLELQTKVNAKFFSDADDRARIRDQWNYITAYDLSNPNTLGTSDNVRGGVVPQNRAIDTATSQSTLNNTTMQTAIEAAVANALNGTIPTLEAAIGAAVAASLVNVPKAPAA